MIVHLQGTMEESSVGWLQTHSWLHGGSYVCLLVLSSTLSLLPFTLF